uniref:Uncharacterized protein n=1 Tax=Romanomermis culicivorax TaxID=13658 RepID=A0A915KMH9_ROMCU
MWEEKFVVFVVKRCILVHFRMSKSQNFPALRAGYYFNNHYYLLPSSGVAFSTSTFT